MQNELNFDEIIDQFRSDPFNYVDVRAPHTGVVRFRIQQEAEVEGPSGKWHHINGTPLYTIVRERNTKTVHAPSKGVISKIRTDLDGQFVQAGEVLMTIKHPLKKREIIEKILQQVLYLFPAPERAKYFFSLDIQSRIDKHGDRGVAVAPGDEVFTMSLMKRDTPVYYDGEPGVIHSIYLQPGVSVDQGTPLIGVCPKEKMPLIQKIINHVKVEWE